MVIVASNRGGRALLGVVVVGCRGLGALGVVLGVVSAKLAAALPELGRSLARPEDGFGFELRWWSWG